MEIIEKQVEKTKEVPCGYWDNYGYSYGRNINGKANAGLALGIDCNYSRYVFSS